jgi:transcriptional regulator with XRE-family HTH domain
MRDLVDTLRKEFHRSEDYRYAYDEEFANTLMATQIKVLRENHDPPLTQKQLAERAGMKQSRISELENVSYSAWSISTLRRLARALGVRLVFKLESWGELLPEIETFGSATLERPSFENDPAFKLEVASVTTDRPPSVSPALQRMLLGHEAGHGDSNRVLGFKTKENQGVASALSGQTETLVSTIGSIKSFRKAV